MITMMTQGICTLLVQGRSIADGARNHLAHLASTRRFLRSSLFTRWGVYVWKELDYFSVDNHLMKSPCLYRGRPITESNIQVSQSRSPFNDPGSVLSGLLLDKSF